MPPPGDPFCFAFGSVGERGGWVGLHSPDSPHSDNSLLG